MPCNVRVYQTTLTLNNINEQLYKLALQLIRDLLKIDTLAFSFSKGTVNISGRQADILRTKFLQAYRTAGMYQELKRVGRGVHVKVDGSDIKLYVLT